MKPMVWNAAGLLIATIATGAGADETSGVPDIPAPGDPVFDQCHGRVDMPREHLSDFEFDLPEQSGFTSDRWRDHWGLFIWIKGYDDSDSKGFWMHGETEWGVCRDVQGAAEGDDIACAYFETVPPELRALVPPELSPCGAA